MIVTVKLFGPEAEAAGAREAVVDISGEAVTCDDLRRLLAAQHPALAAHAQRGRLAVNHEFADDDHLISAGSEVALIGQVSGG